MVTSQDVARIAKVSQTTVSRAFRNNASINPETKGRILKIAEELGYYPNYSARQLKQQKSGIIGLMFPDADNLFFASLMKRVEKFLKQRGFRMMVTYTNENPEKERECLESMISSRVEGFFCIPVSDKNKDLYQVLKNSGAHIVQIIRRLYQDMNTVLVNDEMGGYLATRYLLNQGHRNIIITEYGFNEKQPAKTAGYLRALEEFDVSSENVHILDLPFGVDPTALIAGSIVTNCATAIITNNISMTVSALKACKEHKLSIPDDISFIAYDDSPWLDLLNITAITHPMEDIGVEMGNLLLTMLEQEEKASPELIEIKPYLVLRSSIRNLNKSEPL